MRKLIKLSINNTERILAGGKISAQNKRNLIFAVLVSIHISKYYIYRFKNLSQLNLENINYYTMLPSYIMEYYNTCK